MRTLNICVTSNLILLTSSSLCANIIVFLCAYDNYKSYVLKLDYSKHFDLNCDSDSRKAD